MIVFSNLPRTNSVSQETGRGELFLLGLLQALHVLTGLVELDLPLLGNVGITKTDGEDLSVGLSSGEISGGSVDPGTSTSRMLLQLHGLINWGREG